MWDQCEICKYLYFTRAGRRYHPTLPPSRPTSPRWSWPLTQIITRSSRSCWTEEPLFPLPTISGEAIVLLSHHRMIFFRCGCEDCAESRGEDSLRHSRRRINAYRALASPSLIALSSKDPILTAFKLSWELRELAFAECEFKSEYMVGGS